MPSKKADIDRAAFRRELVSTLITIASLVLVAIAELPSIIGLFNTRPGTYIAFIILDTLACMFFWWEFFTGARRADDRKRYYASHWVGLLGAVPLLTHLRWLRILRLVRLLRFLNFAIHITRLWREWGRVLAHSPLQALGIACLLLAIVGGTGIYLAESEANQAIQSFADAMWLAIVSAFTVGYGDLYPITAEGRIVAIAIFIIGVGLVGSFTASIAGMIVREPTAQTTDLQDVVDRLERIEKQLHRLSDRDH